MPNTLNIEDTPDEMLQDLVNELENVIANIEVDGPLDEYIEELENQSGRIDTIIAAYRGLEA